MTVITTNGLEPLDLCLRRHNYPTGIIGSVLSNHKNRHLAFLGKIYPRNTQIYIPNIANNDTKDIIQLWD